MAHPAFSDVYKRQVYVPLHGCFHGVCRVLSHFLRHELVCHTYICRLDPLYGVSSQGELQETEKRNGIEIFLAQIIDSFRHIGKKRRICSPRRFFSFWGSGVTKK